MRADQLGAAILAMREWQSFSIFASPKPASARSSLDRGNGGVAKNDLLGFVGHRGREYEKSARRVYRRKNKPIVPTAPIAIMIKSLLTK